MFRGAGHGVDIHCGRWRHICLTKVGASLQHAISHEPRMSFLRVQGTCWCVDAVVSCIMWWNLRQF